MNGVCVCGTAAAHRPRQHDLSRVLAGSAIVGNRRADQRRSARRGSHAEQYLVVACALVFAAVARSEFHIIRELSPSKSSTANVLAACSIRTRNFAANPFCV